MTDWRTILSQLQKWLVNMQFQQAKPVEAHLMQMVEEARREWYLAKTYFNTVTDNDLIDHAIYTMDAAEQRYSYLLKKAKAERLEAEQLHLVQG